MTASARSGATRDPSELLRAANVHKTYQMGRHELCVLSGAALRVRRGESVAIVGASGAGKSTLLHILGGLDRPQTGGVWLDGEDLYAAPAARRTLLRATKVGFVFQSYHLLPEMDVLENVMLPAMAVTRSGAPRRNMRRRAMGLLDAVGLAARAAHTPMELSGGEQQRVAVARALMNDPDIILADEPTGNLDDDTGRQVLDHLFGLSRHRGRSLVVVTHNEQIASASDRVLNLRDGALHEI
ncbi:MAG: ABC transporter ATP-binding protein [Lentisphaerae bacterium]|nr:ABC transporter ATP-binding protein [Lentisphaerota bacterium]